MLKQAGKSPSVACEQSWVHKQLSLVYNLMNDNVALSWDRFRIKQGLLWACQYSLKYDLFLPEKCQARYCWHLKCKLLFFCTQCAHSTLPSLLFLCPWPLPGLLHPLEMRFINITMLILPSLLFNCRNICLLGGQFQHCCCQFSLNITFCHSSQNQYE